MKKTKLKLQREMIRSLTSGHLGLVVGGSGVGSTTVTEQANGCNTGSNQCPTSTCGGGRGSGSGAHTLPPECPSIMTL